MLFSSPVFIFYFLPITLTVALLLRVYGRSLTPFLCFVSAASLAFYAYSNPAWLPLIISSIVVNFLLGYQLATAVRFKRSTLIAGITFEVRR